MEFTQQQQEGNNEVPSATNQEPTDSTPQACAGGGAPMEYYSPEASTPMNGAQMVMAYPQAYHQAQPMYMQHQGSFGSYPTGTGYMAHPMTVPQFVAPRYTQYQLPGGAPVTYLPPVMKKTDGKKKKKGFCC
eukprot:GHVS01010124.1.p2 GENE.GHVS01010124.1~~GHVS01010124.1.p2  ORF type:complete len:132 (+),score=32.16 GHVS01010124.1:53-448(+)